MPELPEVHTTATILNKLVKNLVINNVWTNYGGPIHIGKNNIKNKEYFKNFKKEVSSKKIISAGRIGKNVLIHLSNKKTIVVHMKMTGHILYGKYLLNKKTNEWKAVEKGPLQDPFNRFIRFLISFTNGRSLALSDMRKFARITLVNTNHLEKDSDLKNIGPDTLKVSYKEFKNQLLKKPRWKIKHALLDQELLAGIGNIYSDEALWMSDIHPESLVSKIPEKDFKKLYSASVSVLKKGIDFKGDSMSDYRNPYGEKGSFQLHHKAYRRTGQKCLRKKCFGKICRIPVGGRNSHFCDKHQKLFA
jgi:formamidopyrimidine-DNA glycosylase